MELLISLSSSLRLVPFTEELVEAFVEFRNLSSKESRYVNPTTFEKAQTLQQEWTTTPKKSWLLIAPEGVVGQLFITINKDKVRINLLSVLASYFKTGAAKLLIDKVKKLAKTSIELIVASDNIRAQRFYEKMGFKHSGMYNKKNFVYTYGKAE